MTIFPAPPTDRTLGILMLDTRFPRPRGDIGNPQTFAYPVKRLTVRHASPDRVIRQQAHGLVDEFVAAAQALQNDGCHALITSCGFLALHQETLAKAVTIPVATSALLLLPLLATLYGSRSAIGVLTASAASLTPQHLAAVGARADTPIGGVRGDGEFARVIIGDAPEGDFDAIRDEIVEAACRLKQSTPAIAAIVLECTNMPPYRAEIQRRCGVAVFDLVDLADLLMRNPAAAQR